jgi:hypothetical protein
MLKKVITWGVVIFVVYFLATQPSASAGFVHTWWVAVRDVGSSLAKFVTSL